MEALLKSLENDNECWTMDFDRYENFLQVAESFGCEFINNKTNSDVQGYLIEKIQEKLTGEEISRGEYKTIEDHLALKFYISDGLECRSGLILLRLVRRLINIQGSITDSLNSWMYVRDCVEAYFSISEYREDQISKVFLYDEIEVISKSVIFLNSKGYKTDIVLGDVVIDPDSEDKLLVAIDYRFNKLGFHAVDMVIKSISRYYCYESQRYFLRQEPSITFDFSIDTPWGYLFNLSLANLHEPKKLNKPEKLFDECVTLSKHYFAIQRIQKFNKFEEVNLSHDTILRSLRKNILYDQQFSMDQIRADHIYNVVKGLFSNFRQESHSLDVNIYIDILDFSNKKSSIHKPLVFTVSDVVIALRYKYSEWDVENALNYLSFCNSEVNKNYLNPNDIERRNYFERPFFCQGKRYFYISPILCNYGFYNRLVSLFESEKGGGCIGKLTESYVVNIFGDSGIECHSGKTYKISSETARELNIKSQSRECDLILETDSSIIFIELKRKTLTSKARGGDVLSCVVDIARSMLHALAQTGCHEYSLRKNGQILFEDGTDIKLSGRNVERIALSLFGYYGIQDTNFVHQILGALLNTNIDSGDLDLDSEVNKYIREITNQYSTEIFQGLYFDGGFPFFNCRFISVPQLIEILSNCSNNEDFLSELGLTRNTSTGCNDWFKDYSFIRKLRALGNEKS